MCKKLKVHWWNSAKDVICIISASFCNIFMVFYMVKRLTFYLFFGLFKEEIKCYFANFVCKSRSGVSFPPLLTKATIKNFTSNKSYNTNTINILTIWAQYSFKMYLQSKLGVGQDERVHAHVAQYGDQGDNTDGEQCWRKLQNICKICRMCKTCKIVNIKKITGIRWQAGWGKLNVAVFTQVGKYKIIYLWRRSKNMLGKHPFFLEIFLLHPLCFELY